MSVAGICIKIKSFDEKIMNALALTSLQGSIFHGSMQSPSDRSFLTNALQDWEVPMRILFIIPSISKFSYEMDWVLPLPRKEETVFFGDSNHDRGLLETYILTSGTNFFPSINRVSVYLGIDAHEVERSLDPEGFDAWVRESFQFTEQAILVHKNS